MMRLVQSLKASMPISVTRLGRAMLASPVQPLNAQPTISLTLLGTMILVSLVQPLNVLCIFVTLFGIAGAVVSEVQP